ncbi:MAG: response regulator transcription factor [Actinomyces sp.]|jgi:regulatory protein|uniref:response regulator transcription factor n=1 Tax=Actinomyces sp. oral taxon 448 TaxID=712124 RepID=UPI001CAD36F4|nr:response regulator transcription factor [Actinomyces sp. oral taxon 448]MBF0968349.1 response regulator transcription factor [Actinomyces sp.]
MTVRVAVVDDQTLFAETLRTALNTDPGVDVVAVLSSGAEFLKTVSSTAVDVALIDVDMPGMSGLETVRALADIPQAAAVQVVMLTVFTSPGVVRAALDARVAGFLGKNVHTRELLRAIRTAADGGRVVDPELAAAAALIGPNPLTETERRVLRCTQGGTDTQSIAAELLLTVGTVKNHLSHVIQKLGVHNRVEAFQKAQQNGWI